MAEPDPDMEEMRLMSYEPFPRACKDKLPIPKRNDCIEVMWCLDHLPGLPERWCIAEVLHVAQSPAQDVIAKAVIRYLPGDTWDEEIHSVEFLANHRLRRTIDEAGDEYENSVSENRNPTTRWKCARHLSINTGQSDDEEWNVGPQNKRGVNGRFSEESSTYDDEFKSLRAGHAKLVVEIEKMKKILVKHSRWMATHAVAKNDTASCSSAGCVLTRLRHRIGVKMQGGLRTLSVCTGKRTKGDSGQDKSLRTGDGIHVGILKAKVECTLDQFESVSAFVKGTVDSKDILFSPEFSHTQLPSPCSAAFSILFSNIVILLSRIGVTSLSDVLEIARKCGSGPQGDIVRLLGTYQYNKDDENAVAVISVGSSRSGNIVDPSDAAFESSMETPYPLMIRKTRTWDEVDKRFTHPLSIGYGATPALEHSMSETQAFALNWRRETELGTRVWSKGMIDSAQVFGWLEICLPYIQIEGRHLCAEVGGILGDDLWQDMFDKGR